MHLCAARGVLGSGVMEYAALRRVVRMVATMG